jgi:hypothetical protein
VKNSSDGHDDFIGPVATRKHSSDEHDDVMPIATVFFLLSLKLV